jgi:hypothetical protein
MSRKVMDTLNVYLEVGQRRTFAAALDWPGWCRMGRDEESALQALFDYGPRFAKIMRPARLSFKIPKDVSAFIVMERLKGNATTDFGAPAISPAMDSQRLDDKELRRLQAILKACWRAFDGVVETAGGKTLSTGPRGGGRTVDGIVEHVLGAEAGYLASLGGKVSPSETNEDSLELTRQAILQTLQASAARQVPAFGPRGGKRWSPRYFVRRDAWHVLDHVWKIEDRLQVDNDR